MLLDHENSRLAALRQYDVLDSPREEEFDRIALMGARLFDVAVSCITLVDKDRFFFKAGIGSDVRNLDRQPGFCDTTIQTEGVYCIEDTTVDPTVKNHPLVSNSPHIKSYAGSALITREGFAIGTLCIMDSQARTFTDTEKLLLQELAEFVMFHLDRRRRRIEAARREERERDVQKLESLGMLAGGIAHDFNNLLVGVLGNASLAAREIDIDSPAQDLLTGIIRAADQASELTDQLLAYAGQRPMSPKPVDLSNLISNMLPLLRSSISTNVSIEIDKSEDLAFIKGDPTQIRQVVLNLITNASDAYGDGEGTIRIRSKQTDRCPPKTGGIQDNGGDARGFVRIDVEDSGCGMDADTLNSIFSPFFSTKVSGRGLGMSIVQRIVRGHGGEIHVESELGHGCKVSVWLPVASSVGATEVKYIRRQPEPIDGSGTVLVVDDEDLVLQMTKAAVTSLGFDVRVASSGAQALERIKASGELKALILDATMPGMNCASTLNAVKEYAPDIPTIITSGHHADEVASRFNELDSFTFLQKPWTLQQLSSALQDAMHSRQPT